MVYSTNGIILHYNSYSESSIIIKIYTALYGLQTYILKGYKNNRNKLKKTIIQPLSIVEIVAYHNSKSDIHLVKEINIHYQSKTLYSDIRKTTVVFFLSEILYKSIKEEESNQPLFDFIYGSLVHFDKTDEKISIFNLFFLMQLTKYLGFFPESNFSEKNAFFDIVEGIYKSIKPEHSFFIGPELTSLFFKLSISEFENYAQLAIDNNQRKVILHKICDYYKMHSTGFGEIKSLSILEQIFSD